MIISQAPISARVGEIDLNKKSRLFLTDNKEFKFYKKKNIKFNQFVIKEKKFDQEFRLKPIYKKGKRCEDKALLKLINKYQFKRDLDADNKHLYKIIP